MDESGIQALLAEYISTWFSELKVEKMQNSTYDILITSPLGKEFLIQITRQA